LRESADDQFERFNPTLAAAAWMGDNDTAFGLIEQLVNYEASAADHYYESHGLVFNPAFKRLRSDPRWAEFRNSIGMSEERLAAIQFNPELPE
jgi:hypothetical protein